MDTPGWDDASSAADQSHIPSASTELALLDPVEAGLRGLGFGLADLEFVLEAATNIVESFWVEPPMTLKHSGYVLSRVLPDEVVEEGLRLAQSGQARFESVDQSSWRAALDFLDAGRAQTPLDSPLGQRPLRWMGDVFLYDALHAAIAGPQLWDVSLAPQSAQRRSRSIEPVVHEQLAQFGDQPWPSGRKIRRDGDERTDVDASVAIGETLVVVDCYASPWSHDLDRGLHGRIASRLSNLRTKLAAWDKVWHEIVAQQRADLPSQVRQILPVIVSTQAEWIDHDRDPLEWLAPGVPRFCTLDELCRLLAAGNLLQVHPALIVAANS